MTTLEATVLLIEDDPVDAELVLRGLRRIPQSTLDIRWVTSLGAAIEAVAELQPQIVLTDLTLPDARNLEVLTALVQMCTDSSLIVQTGVDDEETPIKALELGAQDFLQKGSITSDSLGRSIRYALARRRTQAELLGAQQEKEQSVDELDGFAHVVAHDLRAPVRTARLFADRLLHAINSDDPVVQDYGHRLDSSLEKVDRMILSMLDYAALRGIAGNLGPVDVAEMIKQCQQLVRADLVAANGEVRIEVEPDVFASADEEQLTRVILNLFANSIKYCRDGVPIEIDVAARRTCDTVTIDVIDNGIGVAPVDAERAFKVLERLDPRRSNGLGFGLAIARRIIEGFGGTIRFVDGQTAGAHIRIVMPSAGDPGSGAAQPGSSTTRQ